MKETIATPSITKQILERFGLRAKKGFGQNFLVDPIIVERCAKESHSEDAVIEIGPGIGSLTQQLAKVSQKVICYEIDLGLKDVLAYTVGDLDNVEIRFQDFLDVDLGDVIQELKKSHQKISVCANLPYYVTTPILFKLFSCPDIQYITVMVQKEVGDRFVAKPNDPEYSGLSVQGQYAYEITRLFKVPGRSFNPSPNVDSVIIQFARKDVDTTNIEQFNSFVRTCFKQRRKTIYNNLKDVDEHIEEVLQRCGIDGKQRPQELSVMQIRQIYEALQ